MSVRVISREPPKEMVREATCKNCGWTHSYIAKDVTRRTHTDYGGGTESYWTIPCLNNHGCENKYIEVPRP